MTDTSKTSQTPRPKRRGKWLWILVILLLIAAVPVLAVLLPERTEESDNKPPASQPITVELIQPVESLPDDFVVNGTVMPQRVVRVGAEVGARVERFGEVPGPTGEANRPIDEGDTVREGQLLVVLNRDLIEAEYQQALAQYRFAKTEYERVTEMFGSGAAVASEVDDARTRVQVTKAQMDLAQSRLDRTDIVAPIAGVLNRLPVEVGEYCQPGQHVAEIVDIATAKVVVDVPEKDIYYLQVGDKVEVLANAREPVEVTGTIRYISELADPVSKTTSVEVAVPNPRRATGRQPVGALQPSWQSDRLFRSGQIVKVRITRRLLRDAIMVPMRAVIPTPEKDTYYVYVEENGLAQRRDVAIGLIRGVDVQVTEGLNAGDRLIVEGQRFVAPDQPVQITGGLADPDARPPTPERPEPNAPTPAQTAPDANPAEPTPPEPDRPDRRDAGDRRDTGADRPAGRR